MDGPLLEICEDQRVTFVRVVDNDEEPTATLDVGNAVLSDDEMLSESERSSSEEEEFIG